MQSPQWVQLCARALSSKYVKYCMADALGLFRIFPILYSLKQWGIFTPFGQGRQYPQELQSLPFWVLYRLATSLINFLSFSEIMLGLERDAISIFVLRCSNEFIPLNTQLTFSISQRYWNAHSTGVLFSSALSHNFMMFSGMFSTRRPPRNGSMISVPISIIDKKSSPSIPVWYVSSR